MEILRLNYEVFLRINLIMGWVKKVRYLINNGNYYFISKSMKIM